MGLVRWTAKGLKLAGDILDSEDVEKWVLAKGQSLIERELTRLPARWLLGESRAQRRVRTAILDEINANSALRTAVENQLASLPSNLEDLSREIWTSTANVSDAIFVLAACPRDLVIQRFTRQVVTALKDSALLKQYDELPELLLTRVSQQSEAAFFAQRTFEEASSRCRVIGKNENLDWQLGSVNGHYYVGFLFHHGDDLTNRNKARKFARFCADAQIKLEDQFGRLSLAALNQLRANMRKFM